jgi:hypothetical protein
MAARVRRRGLGAVLAILILLTTHIVYSFAVVGASLWSMRSRARKVVSAAGSDDLAGLSQRMKAMEVAGAAAAAAADGGGLALLGIVPGIGADTELARFAAHAAQRSGRFGVEATTGLERDLGSDRSLAQALYRDGQIDFTTVAALGKVVADGRVFVADLAVEAADLDTPATGTSQRLLARAQRALNSAVDAARRGELATDMLPRLAAKGIEKRYLLAFQSPSEARGSGGIIGVYGIVVAEDGRLRLAHVGPQSEIGKKIKEPVAAPPWYDNLYGGLLALKEIRLANLGAHFPTVARLLLDYYEAANGESLDGVITVDPIVLEQITSATPPLRGPGWDVRVDESNARRLLLKSVYLRFGRFLSKAQNRFFKGLVADLLDDLGGGRVDATALARGLVKAANWQHLKIYATDTILEDALGDLGLDGDFTRAGTNVQEIFHNNFTGSKVDYFLRREQHTSVQLATDGTAEITTTMTLENRAPTEPSSLLIRPLLRKYPNGYNRMTLSFLLPRGARFAEFRVNDRRSFPLHGNELGYPVVWDILDIPSGDTSEVSVTYRLPHAVDEGRFSMTLWPQALVRPDRFRFELRGPEGSALDVIPRRRLADGAYVLSGRLFGPKQIEARVQP